MQGQWVIWRGLEEEKLLERAVGICQCTFKPSFFLPQSKPLIPLQKEEDPESHKTVLTNYMFPQQIRTEDCEYCAFNRDEFLEFIDFIGNLADYQTANFSDLFFKVVLQCYQTIIQFIHLV